MISQKLLSPTCRAGLAALALSSPFLLASCGGGSTDVAAPSPAAAVEVEVQTIAPQPRALISELPGRISPVRVAEVRARVAGIVQKRHFVEGAAVKEGALLYTIEAGPFEAALGRVQGALARADAQVKQAQSVVRRYEPLVKANAVSQQEYDDALSALQTAEANQLSARADVKTAQLDLGYATVRAPISGRIGRSLVSEGALVGQGTSTPMAVIQQMDPVYADFTQPAQAVLRLREAVEDGKLSVDRQGQPSVTIQVEGTRHTVQGRLLFSDVTVDPGTGQVMLRGIFPNPKGLLMPGVYVRASTEQGVDEKAVFVPQRAILRGPDGISKVMTVSADGKAQERPVQTGAMQGAEWQVIEGLKAGDQVIVSGAEKIAPGTAVTVKAPAAAAATSAASAPSATASQ